MLTPPLAIVALLNVFAALSWGASARLRGRVARWVRRENHSSDAVELSRSIYVKDLLATFAFVAVAGACGAAALIGGPAAWAFVPLALPALASIVLGRRFPSQARLSQQRWAVERRAEETMTQDQLAPRAWADRLASEVLPELTDFEASQLYQAAAGLMAGDFTDVFDVGPGRVAAVIGDVSGRGIEASITAFQAKYLLRVFLREYRDPAQALEQLNETMSSLGRDEEFLSVAVVIFDKRTDSLRYASAGHSTVFFVHDRVVNELNSTGPLVMMQPTTSYFSRDLPVVPGDLLVMYTDGLSEARSGSEQFGESRIAEALRRSGDDPVEVLVKDLVEQAQDFADGPISDDVAILALRRR